MKKSLTENLIFSAVEIVTVTVSFFTIILRLLIFKNWHYFSHFLRIFKGASTSENACVRLTLKKWELTGIPGHNKRLTFSFFNWDSPHARLNSHYKAWSYKKRGTKRITGYSKSVITSRTPSRKRKGNQLSQFWRTPNKVIPIEKT